MNFYNDKKALLNLQNQLINTQQPRKQLVNRPITSNEYIAEKIRAQSSAKAKKSKSNLYSLSSSSLYRHSVNSNTFISNPSPRVRLRNLACKTQPYRSFFTRLSTVFEEDDNNQTTNNTNMKNLTDLNNTFTNTTNRSKSSKTLNENYKILNNVNRINRLVSHKLNGTSNTPINNNNNNTTKKFKPTAYYSSFENEKNEIDYDSFLYTDPSLNNNKPISISELNSNNNNRYETNTSKSPSLKSEFRMNATDKNILNEFNLLLLDELKRIKSKNYLNDSDNNNNQKISYNYSLPPPPPPPPLNSQGVVLGNIGQMTQPIMNRQQSIFECLIPNNNINNLYYEIS